MHRQSPQFGRQSLPLLGGASVLDESCCFPPDAGLERDSDKRQMKISHDVNAPLLKEGPCERIPAWSCSGSLARRQDNTMIMIFLASQRLEMLKYLFFQKIYRFGYPQTYPKIILQSSSAKNIIEKSSSPSSFIPPPHRFYSLRFHFPFLPVPSRSLPFSISLFLFPCSISFLFFLFLVLSNSLCPALFLLSLFTLPLPETDRKSKKLQNPPVFFKKSSKNLRTIIEKSSKNHPQPTFSGPNPLHSGQESKKLQNPPVFFKKSSKNLPQPTFSGPNPLHSGQESKKLQNPPVFFKKSSKNLRKIIEKSSKHHPQPTFSGPTPLHSGQESKKLQNPPVFSKNHRTIFENSSKNLRKIIDNLRKIIPNPNFLDQPPFTVVRKAKSCKTLLFFFKKSSNNLRNIIEKSSKDRRKIFEKSS